MYFRIGMNSNQTLTEIALLVKQIKDLNGTMINWRDNGGKYDLDREQSIHKQCELLLQELKAYQLTLVEKQ